MGTNFYWSSEEKKNEDDIQIHIGKRSAGGLYCWDCGTVFHRLGTHMAHSGKSELFDACPGCGKTKEDMSIDGSTAGVELGFNRPSAVSKKGISTCCSFTWTLMKHKKRLMRLINSPEKVVRDEYGREYTAREFLREELSHVAFEFQSPYAFS